MTYLLLRQSLGIFVIWFVAGGRQVYFDSARNMGGLWRTLVVYLRHLSQVNELFGFYAVFCWRFGWVMMGSWQRPAV